MFHHKHRRRDVVDARPEQAFVICPRASVVCDFFLTIFSILTRLTQVRRNQSLCQLLKSFVIERSVEHLSLFLCQTTSQEETTRNGVATKVASVSEQRGQGSR